MDIAEEAYEEVAGSGDEVSEEGQGSDKKGQVRSDDIRMRLRQEDVVATVHRKKKQWLRKMEEMPEERLVKTVYMEEMPGKSPRGRPRNRWEDDL